MMIPLEQYDTVRKIVVDQHPTRWAYEYWEGIYADKDYLLPQIRQVKASLGLSFDRTDIVNFYKSSESLETKFIAAMIWGHEASDDGKRDPRGPWKLSKIFEDSAAAENAIRMASVASLEDITRSYNSLNKALKRCGPSFFTKHFYFLGKASKAPGEKEYPVIFDDRVARGLVKLSSPTSIALDMVSFSAATKPEAYRRYLNFVFDQARAIECEPDQIEYYLFTL